MQNIFGKDRSFRGMHFFIILGISMSVAALLVAISVVNGFRKEYTRALLDFNADVIVLMPHEKEEAAIVEFLKKEELLSIQPFFYREALVVHKGKIKGVVLKGTEVETPKMGSALYEFLGKPDQVRLMLNYESQKTLPIAETFSVGLYEYDSQFIQVPLKLLRTWTGEKEGLTGFELKLSDPYLAERVAKELKKNLPPEMGVTHWAELNSDIFRALAMEKGLFQILLGMLVFVASLNLVTALLLQVFYKRRAIGIVQALGLSQKRLRRAFSSYGLRLGIAGSLLGLGLAYGICLGLESGWVPLDETIYFIPRLPVDFQWGWGGITALLAVGMGWFVAWWASRQISFGNIRENLHGPA